MSFEKIAQNITQTTFCQNYYVIIKKEKSAPKEIRPIWSPGLLTKRRITPSLAIVTFRVKLFFGGKKILSIVYFDLFEIGKLLFSPKVLVVGLDVV
jgi:hypothetical protein